MTSSEMAERAYVQGMLELADARREAVVESMRADVDRLRDSWATSYAEQRQAHEDRLAEIRRSIHAPHPELPAGGDRASVPVTPGTAPSGHHRQQEPTPDPRAAELAEVERIKSLSWDDYAAERQSRGIGSPTSARGLFAG